MAPTKKESPNTKLLTALNFISLAQRNTSNPVSAYCCLGGGFLTASDGILTAGHRIEEDLEARPHTGKFKSALASCGKTFSLTQLSGGKLTVRSGKFSANIPCLAEEPIHHQPDPISISLNDAVRMGLRAVSHLTQDDADNTVNSSILLRSGSLVATNSIVMIEYWHGSLTLPTMAIPKPFANAVAKAPFPLTGMGFSQTSVTFWFGEECWFKTQVYADAWPDIEGIFQMPGVPIVDLPRGFYEALRKVEEFAEEGREKGTVWTNRFGIGSHKERSGIGAFHEITGLPEIGFGIKALKSIENVVKKIAFGTDRAWFFGDNTRGVIMGVK